MCWNIGKSPSSNFTLLNKMLENWEESLSLEASILPNWNLWTKSFGATTSFWSLMCETWMNHNHSTVTLFIFMVSTSSTDFLQYYVKMIQFTWHERIIWKFTPEIIIKLYQLSKSFLMLMFVSINKFYEDIVVIEFLHTINMYQGNYTSSFHYMYVISL